jgi:tetratricopeptide (TPR) repeat protein
MALETRYLPLSQTSVAALAMAVAVLGCQSEDDRFEHYVRRADAALQAFEGEETAVIELLNALQIRPDDAQVNFRLGELRQNQGLYREAIFFFEEAHQLDPEHSRAAVSLALLLRSSEPERAAAMLLSARERDANNAWIHAAEAELALDRESPTAAIAAAKRAVELEPNLPFAHLALGRAHMGQIRVAQLLGERARNADFVGALAAFSRYAELTGPSQQWNSLLESARVLAAWPLHSQQALEKFQEALAAADDQIPENARIRVASQVLEFARARSDDELRAVALERLLVLEPEHLAYWDELALVREINSGNGGHTLEQLIAEQPDNPEAHLRYSGYLRTTQGPQAAIAHLVEFSENEALRPTLLGALAEAYDSTGQKADRARALLELEDDYTFHPVTLLTRAKRAFQLGQVEDAVQDLRDLARIGGHGEAEGMLAFAEFALGNHQAVLDASSRAAELNPRLESGLLEIRARAAYALGNCPVAGRAMLRLLSENRLDDPEQVQLARCLYRSDRAAQGRKLLRRLLAKPTPIVEAVLEFARREMNNPRQRNLLRRKLEQAVVRDPGNRALQVGLAEARRRDGLIRESIAGLDRALEVASDASKPDLLLLRAQLHSDAGEFDAAQRDAGLALALDPALDGALRLYLSALNRLGRDDEAIAALEARQRAGVLDADRTALLGRLYLRTGKRDAGRDTLLRAYQKGCRIPEVLTALAFMLADDGERLAIALRLAQLAVEGDDESPNSLDTLGYVYLQSGQAEKALGYFDRAVEGAAPKSEAGERAVAGFHFRRGLALQALGRDSEAAIAFEHAHALDATRVAPQLSPTPDVQSQPGSGGAAGAPGQQLQSPLNGVHRDRG